MPWRKNEKLVSYLGAAETSSALTPEGIEFVLFPAGLPARTLAYGIDKIIQWMIILVIAITAAILSGAVGVWFALILNFCVDWFYHVIFDLAFRGQSPGKRIAGIRVVRSDGAPVDAASSFLRNLLRFADTFFFFFPISLICMGASTGFRRLGDWAGGTLVVYTSRTMGIPQNKAVSWLGKYELVIPPYPLSFDEKQAIISFARRYPMLGEARANEIAGFYAPYLQSDPAGSPDIAEENPGSPNRHEAPRCEFANSACILGIARKLLGDNP